MFPIPDAIWDTTSPGIKRMAKNTMRDTTNIVGIIRRTLLMM
jgi:hypothetical protein